MSSPSASDPADRTPAAVPVRSSAPAADPVHSSAPAVPLSPPPEDELPDWEPLTPELVEDEAIRSDAMLRSSVVLLALLCAWTQISDTALLVRIKSGLNCLANGFLPPRTDSFSSTAAGREWVNLGWLSDVALAGLYRAGSVLGVRQLDGVAETGSDKFLTAWGVIAAALAFWLLGRTSLKKVPTWWSSIAAGLAVVAAFPALTAGPMSVTILGLAILIWLLASRNGSGLPYAALFVCWSNLDPQAWIGLAILWSAAIGRLMQRPAEGSSLAVPALLMPAIVATVAAMIHPWHWHVLESPFVVIGTELPQARAYGTFGEHFQWMLHSASSPTFWKSFEPPIIAGIALAGVTLVTLLLNGRQTPFSYFLMFLTANGLAYTAGLFWPAAAIVNAFLSGQCGQAWYVRTFRQTYSIHWGELLYSRVGRAVTVLGLFSLAYLMINGALPGVSGRRLGWGFDWRIRTSLDSYAALTKDAPDDRPFNGRVEHGDFLIWVGQKPFIDSRLALFARGGDNLVDLHRRTSLSMRVPDEFSKNVVKSELWKETFDQFQITTIYARLTGDDGIQKYVLLARTLPNPDLRLTRIDSAAAQLVRSDVAAPEAAKVYALREQATGFVERAFRGADDPIEGLPPWPRELTTYERWLIQPEPSIPRAGQRAEHFAFLASEFATLLAGKVGPGETGHALRVLAIRDARRSLIEDANTPSVHRALRRIYQSILAGEQGFGRSAKLQELRMRELLSAQYFALMSGPTSAASHEELSHLLAEIGYLDASLEHLQKVHSLTGQWTSTPATNPNFTQIRDQNRDLLKQLEAAVRTAQDNCRRELQRGEDPFVVARMAGQAGCPQFALSTIATMEAEVARDPSAALLQAQMMMAVGRMEEAWERLDGTESMFPPELGGRPDQAELRTAIREYDAIANVIRGDGARAEELWQGDAKQLAETSTRAALDSAPLAASLPLKLDLAPMLASRVSADLLYSSMERRATLLMLGAVTDIEFGRLSQARQQIRQLLDDDPTVALRPLAVYYHFMLTGETVPAPSPSEAISTTLYNEDGSVFRPGDEASIGPPPPPVAIPLESAPNAP